jgi:hypothetical protein
VVERTFAEALGVHTGDSIMLNGRALNVVGIAVTAAFSPYPEICSDGCDLNTAQLSSTNPGRVWVTEDEARSLSSFEEPLLYYLNLKLSDPAQAVAAHLVVRRRGGGHRDRDCGTHYHSISARRSPPGGRDPPGRDRVIWRHALVH